MNPKESTHNLLIEDIPLREYPRMQFRRDSYFCLNGTWEFEIGTKEEIPCAFTEKIRVPFPVESRLSGIRRFLKADEILYYRKTFRLEKDFCKDIVALHFDGVDQHCEVYLNRIPIAVHEGGYIPFEVEIQDYLKEENELIVKVKDPLDKRYPYGKQSEKSRGMWYTKTSGIWKTVWIESYPKTHFSSMKIDVTLQSVSLTLSTDIVEKKIRIQTPRGVIERNFEENHIEITLPCPRLWSPEDPYLYDFELIGGEDRVRSYFALRTVEIKEIHRIPRILLNGKPYFFHGLLDQGYFSDGLFCPHSYQRYADDIVALKKLGFNTLRKHIKIEPLYFYYLCDKLGMIIFQDFVNNGKYRFFQETVLPTLGFIRNKNYGRKVPPFVRDSFVRQGEETMALLYNSPSVCYYTIFNEGWGQFSSDRLYAHFKAIDPSRIVDATSGWFQGTLSDVDSRHIYFRKIKVKRQQRPVVLSEFGGYSYPVAGHCFRPEKSFGYRKFKDAAAYRRALNDLYLNQVLPQIENGLCGCIYTQVSDVEEETNGLFTFDRQVLKVDEDTLKEFAEKIALYPLIV